MTGSAGSGTIALRTRSRLRPRSRTHTRAAVILAAALVSFAARAELRDLLPLGDTAAMLRGYCPAPPLDEAVAASQPLTLTAPDIAHHLRLQASRFHFRASSDAGDQMQRVTSNGFSQDLVTSFSNDNRWRIGYAHARTSSSALNYRPRNAFEAEATTDSDRWVLAYVGDHGWSAAMGLGEMDTLPSGVEPGSGGDDLQGDGRLGATSWSLGVGRRHSAGGWQIGWEGSDSDLWLGAQEGADAVYSANQTGRRDGLSVSAWRSERQTTWFGGLTVNRTRVDGPLAASGWSRGEAFVGVDGFGGFVGRQEQQGPRRATLTTLQWERADASAHGYVLGGLIPGLDERGRGRAALTATGAALKHARRRPLHGSTDLVLGVALAYLDADADYVLEEAEGLFGSYEPTDGGWYKARIGLIGLTVGVLRERPDRRVGLALSVLGGFAETDHPRKSSGTHGAMDYEPGVQVGLLWEEAL